ncbi:uncharacterized protein si:ch211-277c7.7 [Danio aesculapii]|uniref:uncharacterized protein si:ch211-277c7.7 n=1 Tax=Danio aesculapii TaxID=1142201 RepID=UPI0024C0772A|nr:uncharacterized protein si:ch211-277c7.7 [Danio aesculapii]
MSTYRKLLYTPLFGSQSFQPDKKTGRNGENKLRKKKNTLTQEGTPLMFDTSPEITPCFSRKVKIHHLLRVYSNVGMSKKKSSVNLRESNGRKPPQRAKHSVREPSSDDFAFPSRRTRTENKMARTKQDVLRTIKRMVEENRVIRVRLLTLRQMSRSK